MKLGRLGVWYSADKCTATQVGELVRAVERNGYSAYWYPEGRGHESMALASHLLSKSDKLMVGSSIANIYARDDHRCQYCGEGFPTSELTFDHVVPVAQGGRKDWENIVSCCVTCNRRKGGRTPPSSRPSPARRTPRIWRVCSSRTAQRLEKRRRPVCTTSS